MLRLLHFADTHFGVELYGKTDSATGVNTRILDFHKALSEGIERALNRGVDVALFAGDAFRTKEPKMTHMKYFFRALALLRDAGIPLMMISGNHDDPGSLALASSVGRFDTVDVEAMGDPEVIRFAEGETPGLVRVRRSPGRIDLEGEKVKLRVCCLPWPHAWMLGPESAGAKRTAEQAVDALVELYRNKLADWSAARPADRPQVLLGHLAVAEAKLAGTERTALGSKDPTFTAADLAQQGFDYVGLGHIHRLQDLNERGYPPVVYPGSIEMIDFGERDEPKGVVYVTIRTREEALEEKIIGQSTQDLPYYATWEHLRVQARKMVEINLNIGGDEATAQVVQEIERRNDLRDAIVRLRLTSETSEAPHVDFQRVQDALGDADYVAPSVLVRPEAEERRRRGIDLAQSDIEAFDAFLELHPAEKAIRSDLLRLAQSLAEDTLQKGMARHREVGALRPLVIELSNFMCYGETPQKLDLQPHHLVCLTGQNGHGKSALFDAFCWALWGEGRKGQGKAKPDEDLIRQSKDVERMRVVAEFAAGHSAFRVTREKRRNKPASLKLERINSEGMNDLTRATVSETQQAIIELVGLDYETFLNSAFLAQGKADQFCGQSPAERKKVLAKMLQLERYEVWREAAREARRSAETKAAALEVRQRESESKAANLAELIDQRKATEAEATQIAASLSKLMEAHERLVADSSKLANAKTASAEKEKLLKQAQMEEKRAAEVERQLVQELGRIEELVRGGKSTTLVQESEILSAEARRLENAFGDLRNKNEELAYRLSGAETECEALEQQKSLLEAHPNAPSCPLCATPLEPDRHYKLVQENEQKLVRVRMAIAALQKERELLRKQGVETRKAWEAAREKSVKARERVAALGAQVAEAKRRQPLLVRELQEAKERLKSATERVSRLEAERRELEAVAAKADQVEALLADSRRHRGELEAVRERLVERLGSLSEQIAQAQVARESVIELRRDSHAERQRARECEFLELAFGKDGIPALIIEGVCPQLEQEANRLLAELTGGRIQLGLRTLREKKSGGFSEALDIVVQDEFGARPLELFSGGEAFRVNFAIRIALSELLASHAGSRLSTLIIDEGFGTQDAEGRELLVEAIRAISERFDLIVVVTHIDELCNEFPVKVEVRKGPEGSQFEVIVA